MILTLGPQIYKPYLGHKKINMRIDESGEVRTQIVAANRCYFGLQKRLKSQTISITTKVQLLKTLIRPIVMYAADYRTVSQSDEQNMDVVERKLLQRIYGPIQDGGLWRSRDFELYIYIYIYCIGNQTSSGHNNSKITVGWPCVEEKKVPNRLLYAKTSGSRKVGG
jgi:hypothetical protein